MTNTTTVYVKRELLELGEELGHGVFGSVLLGVYKTPERKVGMSRESESATFSYADTKQCIIVNVNESKQCNSIVAYDLIPMCGFKFLLFLEWHA